MRAIRVLGLLLVLAAPMAGQQASPQDPSRLTIDRIFASGDFRAQFFGGARWLEGGTAYTALERSQQPRGTQIVRVDAASGAREVLVSVAQLTPPGDTAALAVEDYAFSADLGRVLIYTNSQQVWRTNDRGDYWVLERASGALRKLGGPRARPSTLMFAKFSPDGGRVGYVRERNLYVEDLATRRITQLTRDGSNTRTNGSFDWVYEEELDLHDGWRWSPDGRAIAFWQLDISGVRDYTLLNTTDSLYSFRVEVQYPKAGETNSAGRVGVVSAAGGPTRWIAVPGEPRENYIARMEWTGEDAGAAAGLLLLEHLNRLQTVLTVYLADPRTGALRTLFTEQYPRGWVELFDGLRFLPGGRLLWLGESSGWNHFATIGVDGERRTVTGGAWDVFQHAATDAAGGWVYYLASPDDVSQRSLFRARLDGGGAPERLTPADQPGVHGYGIAPGARYAIHQYSRMGVPPVIELVSLPDHRVVRTLVDNAALRQRVAALARGPVEFFTVDAAPGVRLSGWVIKPPDFDPRRRYPLFLSIYGGPLPNSVQNGTVTDGWGGSGYLWNLMLAQQGYLVAAVENRGTGAHGRDWRRSTYGQLGVLESEDFAGAMRAMWRQWPWIDSTRVGIYGHSYGGFMALNAILRFPDVFSTAISAAPVTNWKYYDTIYTERYMGLPRDNTAGYERGSPITFAANLRGHLLLVHGTGDDNVHVQNSEAMVNALVRAQKQFTLMMYPNRNHGIGSDGAARHRFELYTRFLNEHMPPGPAAGAPAAATP